MTERTGFKYCVGFNSCGSALFIALKTNGVQPGDHVLANGFSFTAVPSAIHHAGGIPVYVESTDAYVMDMEVTLRPRPWPQPQPQPASTTTATTTTDAASP
jgi:dTDP-4-amino-4,6-dideoxygalactose transaminase